MLVAVRLPFSRPEGPWTQEKDGLLLDAVAREPAQSIDWDNVAKMVGRPAQECARRTTLLLQNRTSQRNGEMAESAAVRSHEEDLEGHVTLSGTQGTTRPTWEKFYECVVAHDFDWIEVGRDLGRDPQDCRQWYLWTEATHPELLTGPPKSPSRSPCLGPLGSATRVSGVSGTSPRGPGGILPSAEIPPLNLDVSSDLGGGDRRNPSPPRSAATSTGSPRHAEKESSPRPLPPSPRPLPPSIVAPARLTITKMALSATGSALGSADGSPCESMGNSDGDDVERFQPSFLPPSPPVVTSPTKNDPASNNEIESDSSDLDSESSLTQSAMEDAYISMGTSSSSSATTRKSRHLRTRKQQ